MTPLLTPQQAAEILQKPVATLKKWRTSGDGPDYVVIGRNVFYKSSAIKLYLSLNTHCIGDPSISGTVPPSKHDRVCYTPLQFDQQMGFQRGLCGICQKPLRDGHWDHDHSTGKLREILCPKCNRGIGQLNDSPELCESAAAYLRSHGK